MASRDLVLRAGLLVGVASLGSLAAATGANATILGPTVSYAANYAAPAGQSVAWLGLEGICHLEAGALTQWSGFSLGLAYNSAIWSCQSDGADIKPSGVPVRSTVRFRKLELSAIHRANLGGAGAPDISAAYPRSLTRLRWDVGADGSVEQDESGPWPRGQQLTASGSLGGGHNEQWTRGTLVEFSHRFGETGAVPLRVLADYSDGSSETATGSIPVVADTVSASLTSGRGWYLTGQEVGLDAGNSTALSGRPVSFAWDFGDGAFAPGNADRKSVV